MKQHKTKKGSIAIKSFFIFLAVNLIGLAVALILESGLGCEPIGLLCDGVAHALSIPFGRGCFIYNFSTIILALLVAKKNLGMGTVVYGLLSGFFIDFYRDILLGFALGQQDILIAVIVFAVGELMMAAAFALLMELKLGMTALDAFLVKIEELLHIPYAFLKIGMDICFVITGYLLGGTFGIGTIVSAILTGILVKQWAKIFGWLKKRHKEFMQEEARVIMKKYKRIFVVVLDSLGIGAMPDSEKFGDYNVDTLGHIAESAVGLQIPNLQQLGIANLHKLKGIEPIESPKAVYMEMNEKSAGKDTMTGHWEMMGLYIQKPFQTFSVHGFPKELIEQLEEKTGHKVIGNKSASGTEILDELAEEEIATGHMIVYTSADSVLQICGNEETFGLDELYRCCEIARELTMKDKWKVGRVIARPYTGRKKGEFKRTANRHDYALKPYGKTVLDTLKENGFSVISVGKIKDIFDGEGITEFYKSRSSVHGMEQTIELTEKDFTGLCFVNLVDFDALWGHRRDVDGYAKELEKFDKKLEDLLGKLEEEDLLILTADHGNDPTYTGTDHTREKVPFMAYSPSMKNTGGLSASDTFAVIGATIADNFEVAMPEGTIGTSILEKLM